MSLPAFPPLVVGTAQSLLQMQGLSLAGKREKAVSNMPWPAQALVLMGEGGLAFYIGNQALESLGKEPIPSIYGWAVWIMPPILFIAEQNLPSGILRASVSFLRSNLGLMLRSTAIASQIAVVYFTGSGTAIAALTFFAMDQLSSNQRLPSRVSRIYESVHLPLLVVAGVLAGGWVGIAMCVVVLAARVIISPALFWLLDGRVDPGKNTGQLTPVILDQILQGKFPLRPTLQHLTWASLPPVPILAAVTLLFSCKDKKLQSALDSLFETADQLKRYKLCIIFAHLLNEQAETQTQVLHELTTPNQNLESTITRHYNQEIDSHRPPTLRNKLLQAFQEMRFGLFDSLFHEQLGSHWYAMLPIHWGIEKGLIPIESAINPDFLPWLMWKRAKGGKEGVNSELASLGYKASALIAHIQRAPSCFSPDKMGAWWDEFISAQSSSNQGYFRRSLGETPNFMSDQLLLAMLFEMGILERGMPSDIPPPPQRASGAPPPQEPLTQADSKSDPTLLAQLLLSQLGAAPRAPAAAAQPQPTPAAAAPKPDSPPAAAAQPPAAAALTEQQPPVPALYKLDDLDKAVLVRLTKLSENLSEDKDQKLSTMEDLLFTKLSKFMTVKQQKTLEEIEKRLGSFSSLTPDLFNELILAIDRLKKLTLPATKLSEFMTVKQQKTLESARKSFDGFSSLTPEQHKKLVLMRDQIREEALKSLTLEQQKILAAMTREQIVQTFLFLEPQQRNKIRIPLKGVVRKMGASEAELAKMDA